jgi:thioredoxin:protein disulfide reductase
MRYNWFMFRSMGALKLIGLLLCLSVSVWAKDGGKASLSSFGEAQTNLPGNINQNPLRVTNIEINPPILRPGGVSELKVSFHIEKGYRAYLDQFAISVLKPEDVYLSEFQVLPTSEFLDPLTKKSKMGVKLDGTLTTLIQLPSNFRIGNHIAEVELTYQACTSEFCLFPTRTKFELNFKVEGKTGATDDFFSRALAKGWLNALLFVFISGVLSRALAKGWLNALLFVFIAGVLTSFTPCIFPLIPITLAVLGSRDAGGSKLRGAAISFTYVMGHCTNL